MVGAERHGEPGGVLHEDQLERVPAGVDDLATTERRGDRPERLVGDVRTERLTEDQARRGRGRGGVDHGGEAALLEDQRADALGAEVDAELGGALRMQHAVVAGRLRR